MEIDRNIYNQYRDTPFKIDDTTNTQKNTLLLGKKIKNPNMDEYAQYVIENTKEIEEPKNKRTTYNIILRTSYDKTKHSSNKPHVKENSLINNKYNDESNADTNKASSKTDISLNFKMPKNTYKEKISEQNKEDKENDNKENNNMIIDEEKDNYFNEINNKDRKIYTNECESEEENKNNKYNTPFNSKNMYENEKIIQKKAQMTSEESENHNKIDKLPNITLTTFPLVIKNNKEKNGKFSIFLNLFSGKKKDKKENKEPEGEEIKDNDKNKLKTLEQNLTEDNIFVNEDKTDEAQELKQEEEQKKENKKEELKSKEKKYDFVLSVIQPKKEKKNKETEREDNNGMKEYMEENNEEGFSERQNIYDTGDELKKIQDKNSNTFILKAEPIMNDDNKEESIEAQSNLDTSSKISGYDKSSIFTFFTSSKFSQIIKKNSKCSALLLAILLGSCGLFYLAYKKLKLKEIISKLGQLFKVIPGFFNSILAFVGAGIEDFMERYDDIYRFLVGIITVICFWIIFRLLMNKVVKKKK